MPNFHVHARKNRNFVPRLGFREAVENMVYSPARQPISDEQRQEENIRHWAEYGFSLMNARLLKEARFAQWCVENDR